MAKKQKINLKESNPVKYYKRKRNWCAVGEGLSLLAPAVVVLVTYLVAHFTGGEFTGNIIPIRFSFGFVLIVLGVVFVVARGAKLLEETANVNLKKCFVWLYIGVTLWLLSITMHYFIILCFSEFIGSIAQSLFKKARNEANKVIEKTKDAEIVATTQLRISKQEEQRHSEPVE